MPWISRILYVTGAIAYLVAFVTAETLHDAIAMLIVGLLIFGPDIERFVRKKSGG